MRLLHSKSGGTDHLAFSVTELLFAIVIVAALAVLGLSGFHKVSARQKSANCIQNLRRIGVGIHLYAQDHRMHFPLHLGPNRYAPPWFSPYLSWIGMIAPYMDLVENGGSEWWEEPASRIFHCPASPYSHPSTLTYKTVGSLVSSYGINFLHTTDWALLQGGVNGPGRNVPLSRVEHPQSFVIVGESPLLENLPPRLPASFFPGSYYNLSKRHNGGSNLLYADGHVQWKANADIVPGGRDYSLKNWNPNE